MEEHHNKRKIELKPKIRRISLVVGSFCLMAVAASLFSLPFPFVRQVWIREVLGLSGLLHVIAFLLILLQIEGKHSIPALLAGIGLVLNELILSCRGFRVLMAYQGVNLSNSFYFFVSSATELLLAAVLISIFKDFYIVRKIVDQHNPPVNIDPADSLRLLIPSALIYGTIFGIIFYAMKSLEGQLLFTLFKNLAWIVSALSMIGVGMEINDSIDGLQTKKMCYVKVVSHGACLAAILWTIYRLIPIEGVLILS